MGRFETQGLANGKNLSALTELSGLDAQQSRIVELMTAVRREASCSTWIRA